MIYSMTGFGEATLKTNRFRATFQINSVNSRFLDIRINHGHLLSSYENELISIIKEKVNRGKIDVWINISFNPTSDIFNIDKKILHLVKNEIKKVSKICKVKEEISFSDILALKELNGFSIKKFSENEKKLLIKTFIKSLENMCSMRKREGDYLLECMKNEIMNIRKNIEEIKKRKSELEKVLKSRLIEKAKILLDDSRIDQNRLYLELSFALARSDITEEIERTTCHLNLFEKELKDSNSPVGKRLDFISQEILREANTIGSKVQDSSIAIEVVNIKSSVEKLKEQIQNVE